MNPYLVETTDTSHHILLQNTDHWGDVTGKYLNATKTLIKQEPDFDHLEHDDQAKITLLAGYLNKSNRKIPAYAQHVAWGKKKKLSSANRRKMQKRGGIL